MKHDFALDTDGKIDIWQLDEDHHNGPRCMRCDESFCHHCDPQIYEKECLVNQPSIFEDAK